VLESRADGSRAEGCAGAMEAVPVQGMLSHALQHHQAGRLTEAEVLYRQILRAFPDHAVSLHLLGMVAYQTGDLETAAERIRRAIAIKPDAASYHSNLGNVLQKQGLAREAASSYLRSMMLKPDVAEVQVNLANVFLEAGHWEEAVRWYERALALDESLPETHYNLGNALRMQGKLAGSVEAYDRSLALKPDNAEAYDWAGRVLREAGDLDGARARFQRALALDPEHPRAGFAEAMVQLLQGEFEAGWASYERRWGSSDHGTPMRNYAQPAWRGERVAGGRVLMWREQGAGDEIMFAGLLGDALRTGSRLVLECDGRLKPLLARSFPEVEMVTRAEGERLTDVAAQLPIGSLPGLFRTSRESFGGGSAGYLKADPVWTKELRDGYADGRRVVGIAWRSKDAKNGEKRSVSLGMLKDLMEDAGVRWVSLQYGDAGELEAEAAEAGVPVLVDRGVDQLMDMEGFAAQVAAMDLVVTIDNTTAHLAGALGVPVWVLLPFAPDWRWLASGETSLWYAGMRLFRQAEVGDWVGVLERVKAALDREMTRLNG
jgi:tetratricopeptide (TPR) repeat protein